MPGLSGRETKKIDSKVQAIDGSEAMYCDQMRIHHTHQGTVEEFVIQT